MKYYYKFRKYFYSYVVFIWLVTVLHTIHPELHLDYTDWNNVFLTNIYNLFSISFNCLSTTSLLEALTRISLTFCIF